MKSRFLFQKRFISVWEHIENFGLQSPSIQLNSRKFWLSHITVTDHNFKMSFFCSAAICFFDCSKLWIRINKRTKSIVLQMVFHFVFVISILQGTTAIYSTSACTRTLILFAFPHAAPMTCRVPNRV